MPSVIRRFELSLSWLYDHQISVQHLRPESLKFRNMAGQLSRRVSIDHIFLIIDVTLTVSGELVE
jgi:hypothetical protein